MLLSIERAHQTLPKSWLVHSSLSVMATGMFLLVLFPNLSAPALLYAVGIAALAGFMIGMHLKYRSRFTTATVCFGIPYFVLTFELMWAGGVVALAPSVTGYPNLCWAAFIANAFFMILSLLAGAYREAKVLEWGKSGRRQSDIEKCIDFANHRFLPHPTITSSSDSNWFAKYGMFIIAFGAVNIPLLFDLFAGGRNNGMFLVAPLMTATFMYINLKNFGPTTARLALLRKFEKAAGRRFTNADYEQIQELRRTFFLSRWLMKDYTPSRPVASTETPRSGKKKRR